VSGESTSEKEHQSDQAAIREATLRVVVPSHCEVIKCLIGIMGKPAPKDLLQQLESLGRVGAASADDYVIEDGAVRAFSKRRARLIDVRQVKRVGEAEARVEVAIMATGLDSTTCMYNLHLSSGVWTVDREATRCTIS
jgi:hypothetical protein